MVRELERELKMELLATWRAQGHYMNGAVVESAEFVAERATDRFSVLVKMFPYAGYVDRGVPAAKIPFSQPSGRGGRSKYIQALIRYAEKKMGLPEREAKSVAFAIAMKQKREGMPTRASMRFSSTGKRTGWIDETINRTRPMIDAMMDQFVGDAFVTAWENMIGKQQTKFQS